MATVEFSRTVPADLSERFLLQEAPIFEVVRAQGDVCLWRSTAAPYLIEGREGPARVKYHITDGEHADYLFFGDPSKALTTFEWVCAKKAAEAGRSRGSGSHVQ